MLLEIASPLIASVIAFGVMVVLGWLVGGGGSSRSDRRGTQVLRPGRMFRGLGVFSVLLPLLMAGIALFESHAVEVDERVDWVSLVVAGAFFLLAVPVVMEAFGKQVTLDGVGITHRSCFRRETHIRWEEIEKVSNVAHKSHYLVHGARKKIKFSHFLDGIEQFAKECERRLPISVYGSAFLSPPDRLLQWF